MWSIPLASIFSLLWVRVDPFLTKSDGPVLEECGLDCHQNCIYSAFGCSWFRMLRCFWGFYYQICFSHHTSDDHGWIFTRGSFQNLHIKDVWHCVGFFPFYPLQFCLANHLFKEEGIWDLLHCTLLFVAVVLLNSLLFGQNWRVMILKLISHCPLPMGISPTLFQMFMLILMHR